MDIAIHYPDIAGKLVIVDSYPMLAGIMDPTMTVEKAKEASNQMRKGMEQQTQDTYERTTKSGMYTRPMVTKDSDLDRVIAWGLKSDRTAVTDAMSELFAQDLRAEVSKIKIPVLVMGSWIGYKEYGGSHDTTDANLRAQYTKIDGVQIAVTDTARHFIMWDDPNWMFAQMDRFLEPAKTVSGK
jgi:pimeloyl-ACP methyl ester carboxylesterase